MDISLINASIIRGDFTSEQLDSILDAVRYARSQMAKVNLRRYRVNDAVKFFNNRRGREMHGRVTKVAIKYITVNCGMDGSWRVPASNISKWETA